MSGLQITCDPNACEPGQFAVAEIRREAASAEIPVLVDGAPDDVVRISLELAEAGTGARPQSYAIRVRNDGGGKSIAVRGEDKVGVMYGGLDVAEAIRTGTLATIGDADFSPHILQRGIKFNLPLDLRTPTYSEPCDAAQKNMPEMWEIEFWTTFIDDMARHRYNVLSLWSMHPYPSMVRVPEFPDVALDDVWRTLEPFDDSFGHNGHDYVRPAMLANYEVVKRITIDEKIAFWRRVMQYAYDRGIEVYLFTWNAFLFGAEGKHGITSQKASDRNIEYFRASVRQTIKTYPLLAGIGITAGEGMKPDEMGGMDKEEWLWRTYGEGIRDALRNTPDRRFRLIHRFHMTGLSRIQDAFSELPCPMDLSFKYAVAHMYSVPNPSMIKPVLPLLSPGLRTWLTVRNDDVYSFRWADVDYARAFVKAIPPEDKVAGFYMGPDGYVWGRDFLTRDPVGDTSETVMQKQWLSFELWGRLAYSPDLPDDVFARQVEARFTGVDTHRLMSAWADASKTFPYVTRFFWGSIDVRWFPEACREAKGFYTVRHFMEGGSMPGAGVLNIMQWRAGQLGDEAPDGVTPIEIADMLDGNATRALEALPELRSATPEAPERAREYGATLSDIEAMAHLGRYYAAKTRGACDLALFDATGEDSRQASAVSYLEDALAHWKAYAGAYTRQYVQPVLFNRTGWVDIPGQTANVEADVRCARAWKPGTIDESQVSRYGTAAGFQP